MVKVVVEVEREGELPKGNAILEGDVVSVGPDTKAIKKGDRVYFAPYGIDEVLIKGEKHLIVSEELIIATRDEETTTKGK